MKKIFYLSAIVIVFGLFNVISYAADDPNYIPEYNNNEGAFYANGTPIKIAENSTGDTVITWDGGNQIVKSTVTVFGGGANGTSYDSSNIMMESGTVQDLVGGGSSTDELKPSIVEISNITVNGGIVTQTLSGGGYAYAQVREANVNINSGKINSITGGGLASVVINGVYYNVGKEEEIENSPNRTENANIILNGGIIYSDNAGYGMVFGGGQGYSYVGTSDIKVNGSDLSKAYLTAGGSNGYTGNVKVQVTGGTVNVFQSVNRGIVDKVKIKITGGTINNFYVGGETEDSTVTGIVNSVYTYLLGGKISTLETGKSNSVPLIIDKENYSVVKSDAMIVENDNISSGETIITYSLGIEPTEIKINTKEKGDFNVVVTTEPTGYEEEFFGIETWESSNSNVVTVDENGTVTGVNKGNAVITANVAGKQVVGTVIVDEINIPAWTALILLLTAILGLVASLVIFGSLDI